MDRMLGCDAHTWASWLTSQTPYSKQTKRATFLSKEAIMSATTLSRTYLPGYEDGDELRRLDELFHRAMSARPRYYLVGADPEDRTEVPAAVYQVLQQVVEAMRLGQAVTIQPHSRVLTTQQAADLLGISRPTLVKLLDAGEIPFERAATAHRRVALGDVLDYAERRRQAQYEAIAATSVEPDEDLDEVLAELRASRHAVADRRRAARAGS
jgi:excisionase family DNA binding protein